MLAGDRLFERCFVVDDLHSDAAPARARFDDHRVTDLRCHLFGHIDIVDPVIGPRKDRHAGFFHLCLLPILEPMAWMVFDFGPMNVTPSSAQSLANR